MADPKHVLLCCRHYSLMSCDILRSQLLATGDASGVVKVWHLSTELTAQASNEMEQLNSLALQILSNTSV